MRTLSSAQSENAYLTVYLALTFGIVLSLLLVLIEGTAVGAARLQSEIVADLGLDSIFAEYNREILDQYGLFFIDSSYGTTNGGVGMVENHLSDYMSYNMNPKQDKPYILANTFLYLSNPYLEINQVSYATDDGGLVWKSQAVNYMKSVYGGDIIDTVQDNINKVQEKGLNAKDVAAEISENKRNFDSSLGEEEMEEYGSAGEGGYSYEKVSGAFDQTVGNALLTSVTPSGATISEAIMDGGQYYSYRGNVNKGIGVHEGEKSADGVADELIFNEYLMLTNGTFTSPKDEGLLQYQIEYILYGCNSDRGNMQNCVERLVALRSAANLIAIHNDAVKQNEVRIVAASICSLMLVPQATEALTQVILGMWAIAEGISDVKILLDKGKIPLMKESSEWNVSLSGVLNNSISGDANRSRGLSYNDYMRIFLGLMNKNDKIARSLDIVEMDIRKTDGNSGFRIDRCIDYVNVSFGFNDGYGHEFLFTRSKCYE